MTVPKLREQIFHYRRFKTMAIVRLVEFLGNGT